MAHTPLPWECREDEDGHFEIVGDRQGLDITWIADSIGGLGEEEKANAEFIVKAVNCHQELVDALKSIQSQCAGHADEFSARVYSLAAKALAKAEA